ncbi:MAG TPA: TatD family hydrolase [Parafilimonas sp.]|nr:TatD family hydrolase [Parafilimonas sp.]
MFFIDTHCHLYLPEFKDNLNEIITRAINAGVEKFYMPAIDSSVIESLLATETAYPGKCFAMMGLHPCSVTGNYKEELVTVENWLNKRSFVAVGEIGLDFYWDTTFTTQQYETFEIQMQWALNKNLPIVIHTRNAMQQTIDFVKPFAEKGLRGIFHCFGDTYEKAKQIIDMNFYLGIGGVLTYKNSGLSAVIKQIDMDNIVLETDAPYLTPVPFRGKRNESSYIKIIAEKLAEVKNISLEEVAAITTANAEKIFATAS